MIHSFTIINADIAADPTLWDAAIFRTSYRDGTYPDVIRTQYGLPLDTVGVLLDPTIVGSPPSNLPESYVSNLASVTVDIPTTTSNDCYIAVFYQTSSEKYYFSTPLHCLNEEDAAVDMPFKFDTILTGNAVLVGDTLNESVIVTDITSPLPTDPTVFWAVAGEVGEDLEIVSNNPYLGFVRRFLGDVAIMFGVGNLDGPSEFTVIHNNKEQKLHSCGVTAMSSDGGGTGGTVDLSPVLDKLDALMLQVTTVDTNVATTGQTVGAKVDLVGSKVDSSKVASDDQFTGVHAHVTSLQNSMGSRFDGMDTQFNNVRQVVQDQAASIRDNDNSQFSGVQSSISGVHSHMSDNHTDVMEKLDTIQGMPQNVVDMIMDLHAEAMGSWSWDKRTGILTMYDTHGLQAAKFSVTDSADLAARERRADLEDN